MGAEALKCLVVQDPGSNSLVQRVEYCCGWLSGVRRVCLFGLRNANLITGSRLLDYVASTNTILVLHQFSSARKKA